MFTKSLAFLLVSFSTAQAIPLVDGDYTIGPDYTNAPELTARDGVPKGVVHQFTMESSDAPG